MKVVIRKALNQLGFEVQRYTPQTSKAAQLKRIFDTRKTDLLLDVGANIGQYGEMWRNCGYNGKIVSFEPLSSAHSQLERLASQDPLWTIAPRMAIGDRDDWIEINVAGNSQSSSILNMLDTHLSAAPASAYISSEKVRMHRLDTVAEEYIPEDRSSVFLKIDVQGFEEQVLRGATDILPKIDGIQVELSLVPLYQGELLYKEMVELIENMGYELYAFVPGFIDANTGRLLQMDGIFLRK